MTTSSPTAATRALRLPLSLAAATFCLSAIGLVRGLPAQETVTLKIRNDLSAPAKLSIRSLRPRNPSNPWATLEVAPRRVQTIQLASPDNFIIRGTLNGVTHESAPMSLKQWLKETPDFELVLSQVTMTREANGKSYTVAGVGLQFTTPPEVSAFDNGLTDKIRSIEFKRAR